MQVLRLSRLKSGSRRRPSLNSPSLLNRGTVDGFSGAFSKNMSSPTLGPLKRKPDSDGSSFENGIKKPKTDSSITSFFAAPKSAAGGGKVGGTFPITSSTAAATTKFDKEKWIAKLTTEQKNLLQLEIDTLHESWLAHLKDELLTPSFLDLKRFLQNEIDSGKKVFPPLEDVYSWLVIRSVACRFHQGIV